MLLIFNAVNSPTLLVDVKKSRRLLDSAGWEVAKLGFERSLGQLLGGHRITAGFTSVTKERMINAGTEGERLWGSSCSPSFDPPWHPNFGSEELRVRSCQPH